MEPIRDDQIVIYDEDGKEFLMNILFTYENEERNAEYVFVYDEAQPDGVYVMRYNEDNELFEVTDEEELKEASEVLEAYNEDPTIQEVKNSI